MSEQALLKAADLIDGYSSEYVRASLVDLAPVVAEILARKLNTKILKVGTTHWVQLSHTASIYLVINGWESSLRLRFAAGDPATYDAPYYNGNHFSYKPAVKAKTLEEDLLTITNDLIRYISSTTEQSADMFNRYKVDDYRCSRPEQKITFKKGDTPLVDCFWSVVFKDSVPSLRLVVNYNHANVSKKFENSVHTITPKGSVRLVALISTLENMDNVVSVDSIPIVSAQKIGKSIEQVSKLVIDETLKKGADTSILTDRLNLLVTEYVAYETDPTTIVTAPAILHLQYNKKFIQALMELLATDKDDFDFFLNLSKAEKEWSDLKETAYSNKAEIHGISKLQSLANLSINSSNANESAAALENYRKLLSKSFLRDKNDFLGELESVLPQIANGADTLKALSSMKSFKHLSKELNGRKQIASAETIKALGASKTKKPAPAGPKWKIWK